MSVEKELRFLKRLKKKRYPKIPHVDLGIGDDCALIQGLLISKDMFVEGVHFTKDVLTPYEIGRKALLVNISDIAAMGGVPLAFLFAISFPGDEGIFESILEGVERVSDEFGLSMLGGDMSGSGGGIAISITILGRSSNPIRRDGVKEGDLVFVTGTLGDSSMGLELIRKGKGREFPYLVWRHKNPTPRVREGALLSSLGFVSSMIDVSDGLSVDLTRIVEPSGLGFRLYWDKIPLSREFVMAADFIEESDPSRFVLYGGEDYELLFTVPKDSIGLAAKLPFPVALIGEVVREGYTLVKDGKEVPINPAGGYSHFEG